MSAAPMRPLPDGVRALLAGPNIAHVATVLPDGAPHSVPVWVVPEPAARFWSRLLHGV